MRIVSLILPALLLAPVAARANDLLKIYQEARDNDAQLVSAGHQRDADVEARPIARGALLPQIGGNASIGRERDRVSGDLGRDPTTGLPIPSSQTNFGSPYSFGVTLNQTVFNWQQISNLRLSGDQVAIAELTYRSAEQDLRLRVAQAYFGVLSALDNLRSYEAESKALGQQLEQAQRRFDVGLSAITDVQDAQARFDATVANVVGGQQSLDAAYEALILIVGHPYEHLQALQEDIPLPAPAPADINVWVNAAKENNYALLQARIKRDIAEKTVDYQEGAHYPTLGLSATDGRRLQALGNDKIDGESVTLSLNVPIFAGGATQALVRQAKARFDLSKSDYELAQRNTVLQTRNAYNGVVSGAAKTKALKQAVTSNTTAVEASQTGLEVGTRTQVDVLTAEQLLYAAQRDYYKSRYDYLVTVLQLKAAAGRLTEADLAEIDKLLVSG